MSSIMWLLVIAWGLLAGVSSIPWFAHAGGQVVIWMRHPGLQVIIALHATGAIAPLVAALSLWRGHRVVACLALTLLSTIWLFWHIFMFTQIAPILCDSPRILLSIITLLVVVVYALGQARAEVA